MSPRGVGKRRGGALARYASGGAVEASRGFADGGSTTDYSDPDATLALLNKSLSALQPANNSIPLFNAAAGLSSPTRSGSTGENASNAWRGIAEGLKGNQQYGLDLARLQIGAPLAALNTSEKAQQIKQQKLYMDALSHINDQPNQGMQPPGGFPSIGGGAPPTVPPIAGELPPPIAAPRQSVAVAPVAPPVARVNPVAEPGAPDSALTAPPDQGGAELRPVTPQVTPAPGPGATPVATPQQRPVVAPAPVRRGIDANGMTIPSTPTAQAIPAPLAQQYATNFNRMVNALKSPLTLDLASKYDAVIKQLVPPGFAFLPDGSGIVPVGEKDPGYLAKAALAGKGLVQQSGGGWDFPTGVVKAEANKAGAISGAQANAAVGAHNAEAEFKLRLEAKNAKDNEAFKTYLTDGVWPPGYGPNGDGKPVPTDKGIVTPKGTVVPPAPEQKFIGSDAIKEQNKNTGETEKTFGAVRGSLEGTEGRIKALADALKVVQSGGLVSHRAEISNTLRGLGLDKAADAFMNKKETGAVQTAIGLQVLDVLGQLKSINQGTGGRILNSEFVNLIDKQYGPDISPEANRALITQALGGISQTRGMIDDYYKYGKPEGWRDANAYQSAYYSDPANSYGKMVKQAEDEVGLLKGMKPPAKRGAAITPTSSTTGGAATAGPAQQAAPQFTPDQIQAEIARRGLRLQ